MTVEAADYISQLDSANPPGSAQTREGSNHIRKLKQVLKQQFPSLGTAAVTGTAAQLNSATGLATIMTFPSATPVNSHYDIIVNAAGFVDNLATLRNNSTDGANAGNAAWRFVDSVAGKERGAMGYSRVNTGTPGGFYSNLLYGEIGNINVGDPDDTDFAIVNSHIAGATNLPNSSYKQFEVKGATGNINFNGPASAVATFNLSTFIGQIGSVPPTLGISAATTMARIREYSVVDQFALTSNVSNMSVGTPITKDNGAKSAWKVEWGAGSDTFAIGRASAAATSFTDFLTVYSNGTVLIPGFLAVAGIEVGYKVRPISVTTGTLVLADRGKCVPLAAAITVPDNVFAAGDVVFLVNTTIGPLGVLAGSGVTIRSSNGTSLLPYAQGTLQFIDAHTAHFSFS